MTDVLDRPTAATIHSMSAPWLPATDAAEDFYRHGEVTQSGRSLSIDLGGPQSVSRLWMASYLENGINALLRLPLGWDGRRAHPLTEPAVRAGVEIVFQVTVDSSLPPQLFPLPDGGIQIEWHVAGDSVEIEVNGDGDSHVLAMSSAGDVLVEGDLGADQPEMIQAIQAHIDLLSAKAAGAAVA